MTKVSSPILTFGSTLSLTNKFVVDELNELFKNPISLDEIQLPLSYYPFSDLDSDEIIMPRVIRELVSLTIKSRRGGANLLQGSNLKSDDVLIRIHPFWKMISTQHRNSLLIRIESIINMLLKGDLEFAEKIDKMRQGRYRVRGPTQSFKSLCERLIQESRKQTTLDPTLDS